MLTEIGASLNHRKLFSLFASALLLSGIPARAEDWPQFHGPNRDNICTETGLLKKWPEGGPPLAWKAQGIGAGFSTVSIAKGRIYTTGDLEDSSYVFALDESTGKMAWKAKLAASGLVCGYEGPRHNPTVDGDLLFAISQHGDLVCFETASGKEVWRKNLFKDFKGKLMAECGYCESPTIVGDRVLVTPGGDDGTVAAMNKRTGEVVWRSTELKDAAAFTSLLPFEANGSKQVALMTDAHVAGFAVESGKMLWSAPRVGKSAVVPTPIFHDGMLFVTSGYGIGCNAYRVEKGELRQVYSNRNMVNQHGGVVRVGQFIYGSHDPGLLRCIELETGKIRWSNRSVGNSSVLYADGMLYVRSESGEVALVECTPEAYNEISTFDQSDRTERQSWAHPVIANGKLYLRDQGMLFCYDVKAR